MLAAPRASRPAIFTNRQVSSFCYRPCRDKYDEVILEYFRCRCGAVRKRAPGLGFTNLMQHTRREHPAVAAEMLEATLGETESLYHYVRHSTQNTFGRLEWIVMGNLPLLFSKNRLARRYTNLEPISVETLRRSVEAVTHSVVRVIAEDIPERFGTIFDGCSHATEHFIAVFAWYEVNGEIRCPLLSMAPLVNEDTDDFVGRNASRLSRRDAIARLQQAAPLVRLTAH
ncbi:hypothetical protein PPTG_20074 [Phytophthora nicotianae INRA-310]|uniref:Uncharacterized protein n=1 Tax=Phytophthora nicotianae (strain INRA-310) TaxID=761204 RepID=W2PCK1_PHYN3|nr:hypothetical protein PPTG_20074 [Phytophthora nicotianae INRA-310]ETM97739.1 hypothetical protein PPTG_20074 [Phytophthora nicotianae INRA-310]